MIVLFSGLNAFGNDVLVGHGATHVPPLPGKHEIEIPVCAPQLVDCDKAAMGHEKECLHPTAEGTVKVTIGIVGYSPPSLELQLEPVKSN
jgi:hypothetical protein